MRTFIAIDLPSHIKEKIRDTEKTLKRCDLAVKWVDPKDLHLTLKFLGNVQGKKIPEIEKTIGDVTGQFTSFKAALDEFGFFPNDKRPRVFFVSTNKEKILKNISQNLEKELEKIGFEKEIKFKPHITLGRFKNLKNIDCLKKEIETVSLKETFPVKEITLFKSTLTKSGPIYEELFKG